MVARFCTGCGAAYAEQARFCIQCGAPRPGSRGRAAWPSPTRYPVPFVVLTVLAVLAFTIVVGQANPKAAPKMPPRDAAPPAAGPNAAASAPAPAAAPPMGANHPPVELPADIKDALAKLKATAEEKASDPEAWRHVANAMLRAAQVDRSYLDEAENAYKRLTALAPADLEALRGLGNVSYDRDQYDTAIDYYQRYLKQKPDDLNVQTDLGTMYLSKGDLANAVRTYEGVLKTDPKFFQAQFNLAIVYRSAGQIEASTAALEKAKEMAPDAASKAQVEMLLARVQGGTAPAPPPAGAAPAAPVAAETAGSFRDGVEAIFRQNPVMASKVQRFEWRDDAHAKLFLAGFPMEQMGDSMKSMFLDRMRERLRKQKDAFKITAVVQVELIDFDSGNVMETLQE